MEEILAPGDIIVKVNLVTSNMWDEMNKANTKRPWEELLKLNGLIFKSVVVKRMFFLFSLKIMFGIIGIFKI